MSRRARTAAERAHGVPIIDGSRALAGLFGRCLMRLTVHGVDNIPDSGALLAVNHNSLLDGPLLYGVLPRPTTFFIKAEAFTGVVGWYLPRIGQIPVRRGVAERDPLLTALAVLAEGGLVGIFPEGTRRAAGTPGSETAELQEVRHGIAYLALRSGCPVLPVACLGTEHVLPKGRTLPAFRRPVTVSIGRPALVAEPGTRATRQAIAAAASRVRDLLADHLRANQSHTMTAHQDDPRTDKPVRMISSPDDRARRSADVPPQRFTPLPSPSQAEADPGTVPAAAPDDGSQSDPRDAARPAAEHPDPALAAAASTAREDPSSASPETRIVVEDLTSPRGLTSNGQPAAPNPGLPPSSAANDPRSDAADTVDTQDIGRPAAGRRRGAASDDPGTPMETTPAAGTTPAADHEGTDR